MMDQLAADVEHERRHRWRRVGVMMLAVMWSRVAIGCSEYGPSAGPHGSASPSIPSAAIPACHAS